ncbi:hypothetical protein Q3G72_011209 [Acer saccharum]|nr:hypothetical protein Q3G72_011209 [Acer saccharum]
MSGRHEKEKGVNVQVLLRCRPFSDDELRNNAPQVLTCNDYMREVAVSQNIAGKHIDRVFTFDKVFGPTAQQKDLYEQAVVPIVNEVLEGFNCTIFAYGQTGTGKTYTMEGECKKAKSGPNGELPLEAGVIPRAVQQIFDTLEGQNAEYSVKVTFLELYNEEITDLLAPEEISRVSLEEKQKKQLPLMEDGKGGVLVRGLEEEIVTSASEIFTLLERGSAKRRTAETFLNKQSSRSHSLFSITIHIKESTPEGEELIKCGKLNLVDLAGSENISRSGAREGRAREAGEINKSLLTLGRVINALVEHLGHIPYRDSKLTRLLRDSLGGRTKTCIIATVSPAVHCLEETLSTLDYAHRAKNIKNKPEVNQKMMKTTLIKDLYGEIERLKAEVYAAREKNGVYIPKERYYQEESERKAMADQIEQMGASMETHQKQHEELQDKYNSQVRQCSGLSSKLELTEKNLNQTSKLLANTEEELKKCRYALTEKDYIISEQKRAENALAHLACVLRSDLEKALHDNASLFQKIGREDKLNTDNRSVVSNFQAELAQQIGSLCNMVGSSVSEQNELLQHVEKLCHSFFDIHNKAVSDMKKKVTASRALYISHMEAVQNVVRLHKAGSNASLEEISTLASSNAHSIEEFLESEAREGAFIYDNLQTTLSTQQGEIAIFARDLRQRFHAAIEQTKDISEYTNGFLQKLKEESKSLENFAVKADDIQMNNIAEFQKAYEEQSKSDAEKLISDMTNLVSNHIRRQKELVDARLVDLRENAVANKTYLDGHASTMKGITSDAKRKWQEFSAQAENDAKDGADDSSAKHCRMELLLQQCVSNGESAFKHWKRTHELLNEMGSKHASELVSLTRNASDSNEQHDAEVDTARTAAEQDVAKNSEDLLQHIDSASEQERASISEISDNVKAHEKTIELFRGSHVGQAACIKEKAQETFQQQYLDYDPTGTTPTRCESEVPSKVTIESLRAMPMDSLAEEFRENNSYESFEIHQVHAQVAVSGLLHNLFVANKLLYIYAHHKAPSAAYVLFAGMRERDAVSWSVMIGGFAKAGDYVNCFRTFKEFINCGMVLDNYTSPLVIRACRDSRDLIMGRVIHDIVLKSGLPVDQFVCAALVDMYAKCNVIDDARQLFDQMPKKDLVTWTVMVGGCAESGNANESLVLFDRMIEEGVRPDNVAMVNVVYACAKLGFMHKARLVHDYITRNRFFLNVILGTAMIDMYAKCGSVDFAREIFDAMPQKNVVSWSAMIAAYGYHGQGRKALDLFPMMLSSGISPNRITFVSLIYACSHAGLVEEGLQLFSSMQDDYAVAPDLKHYTCMVDLLGRAGRLDEALKLIESMRIEKDEGLWGSLLGACRIHKKLELAEMAAKSLLELQPENAGHYVLLSNIYANAGVIFVFLKAKDAAFALSATIIKDDVLAKSTDRRYKAD